uniref:Uncharacterized protein n=1 Tax=Rhizophora mucronata TaxID=61149 RepID=A0A2P2MZ91_RHIMU
MEGWRAFIYVVQMSHNIRSSIFAVNVFL